MKGVYFLSRGFLSFMMVMTIMAFSPSVLAKEDIFIRKYTKKKETAEVTVEEIDVDAKTPPDPVNQKTQNGSEPEIETQNTPVPEPKAEVKEDPQPPPEPEIFDKNTSTYKDAMGYVRNISAHCKGKWETQPCLKTLSGVSLVTVSNYAQDLKNAHRNEAMEDLKQHCAASTAALQMNVPAYAMRSALTECINKISDLNDQTGLRPDPNFSQMIVGSILCLDKSAACFLIELQLDKLAQTAD